MTSQPPESYPEPSERPSGNGDESEAVWEQHLELKQETEQLARDLDRVRGVLQTLVSGLVITVLITLSITAWFAYRLMVQERRAELEMSKLTETEAERAAQIEEIRGQLQSQQQQLQGLQQQIPAEFTTLTDTVQSNQRQLQLLRDRILQLENQVQTLIPSPTPPPVTSPTPESGAPPPILASPSPALPQSSPTSATPAPSVQPPASPTLAPQPQPQAPPESR